VGFFTFASTSHGPRRAFFAATLLLAGCAQGTTAIDESTFSSGAPPPTTSASASGTGMGAASTSGASTAADTGGTTTGDPTTTGNGGPHCGNGTKEAGEACDGNDLGGETCESQGLPGGTLSCAPDCSAIDTSTCEAPPTCGNGTKDPGEVCDGDNLGSENCITQGFPGGTLACVGNCSAFDTSGCDPNPFCGDGIKNGAEACDGDDLGGETCVTQGFPGGTLMCLGNCAGFNTAGCDPNPACGDGVKNGSEVCDGDDLGGETCVTQGFDGGTLVCTGNCAGFDTSGCMNNAVCGNGVKEMGEACDGGDLGGKNCMTEGFAGGMLACSAMCTLDTSSCVTNVCGNGVKEAGEVCDGNDLGGKSCSDVGNYNGGTLACKNDCSGFDTSGCDACTDWGGWCILDSDCCSNFCDFDNSCW